jgi:hypothetical protein
VTRALDLMVFLLMCGSFDGYSKDFLSAALSVVGIVERFLR